MKKILSVFGMLMIISSVTFARIEPFTTTGMLVVKEGATFKVYYKGAEQMDVKVSIYDQHNKIVYSEMVKKTLGFVRPYNFSNLPEGDYTIKVVDKSGMQLESVNYKHDRIEAFAHVRKLQGTEKYLLTVPNKGLGDITVRILDDNNDIIYSEKEEAVSDFGKLYNLENFSGDFVFEITFANGITKIVKK